MRLVCAWCVVALALANHRGRVLAQVVHGIWGDRVQLCIFGSSATGLLLAGGDLDLVILGIGPETQAGGGGFSVPDRKKVARLLAKLAQALRKGGAVDHRKGLQVRERGVTFFSFFFNGF
jgi:hypothetical protein